MNDYTDDLECALLKGWPETAAILADDDTVVT